MPCLFCYVVLRVSFLYSFAIVLRRKRELAALFKETKSATMNIFRFFLFSF